MVMPWPSLLCRFINGNSRDGSAPFEQRASAFAGCVRFTLIARLAKRIANLENAISSKDVLARTSASSMPFVKQIPRLAGL